MRAGSPLKLRDRKVLTSRRGTFEVVRRSSSLEIDAAYFSTPRAVGFPTEDGLDRSRVLATNRRTLNIARPRVNIHRRLSRKPRRANILSGHGDDSGEFSISRREPGA